MGWILNLRSLCQREKRRWVFLVGVVTITHLLFQVLLLPYGNALRSLLPNGELPVKDTNRFPSIHISTDSKIVRNPLTVNASEVGVVKVYTNFDNGGEIGSATEEERIADDTFEYEEKELNDTFPTVVDNDVVNGSLFVDKLVEDEIPILETIENKDSYLDDGSANGTKSNFPHDHVAASKVSIFFGNASGQGTGLSLRKNDSVQRDQETIRSTLPSVASSTNINHLKDSVSNASSLSTLELDLFAEVNGLMGDSGRKKLRCEMPPKSVTSLHEMKRIVKRGRLAMKPRWPSVRDREILNAKHQIENAPGLTNEEDLYAPIFRNVSRFKRSYDIMERTLKVYVYREGEKPVFHQPILKGLYASEGWFMKLMENNKKYLVKDPKKAHLYYMPFSSRMLEHAVYVRNSHNRTNLREYLKDYAEKIAARYPFWNRTDGADHFLVACHDWAPYETRHHMEYCIKALCNADVTTGFKIGRDISLPETYIRSQRNPLRDLGGKPPSKRNILAFYAGNMHGYLRTILLKYWEDKDPDMKIYGPMPKAATRQMKYIEHMKSSKYCLCPKGYEVNSPRVVEAIFYECVPVIISDNFVPPFFDVLDWDAFSVIVAEKDIPRLKDILLSIPKEKYLQMQLGVRRLQRHFLWHAKPVKYDVFHMILHSIWYSRVSQINLR